MNAEEELCKLRDELTQLKLAVKGLEGEVAKLAGENRTTQLLAKWVIFPLIIILGGLVGIKVLLPNL